MAIRPVDLQQVMVKGPDVTHDAAAQSQAATAQQAQTERTAKRQAEQAETVQQFEEAGAVLVRERQAGAGQQGQQEASSKREPDADGAEAGTPKGTVQTRLGRHIDMSA